MAHHVWAQEILAQVITKIEAQCQRLDGGIPYIPENGRYKDQGQERLSWWTNGFWGGILWQLYAVNGNDLFKHTAQALEERLDTALHEFTGLHHDVGFMWLHTGVANYRLTGNELSFKRAMHAAGILAGRYNPQGGFINAWNEERMGWIIIDCMMNLPLLHWAKQHNQLGYYDFIAKAHADITQSVLVRGDGSVYHVAVMNPQTGEAVDYKGWQGYAKMSSWTRGQAWGIYGFALSYLYTRDESYLHTAKKIAHYFMANVAQTGYVPVIDFRAPKAPHMTDTTAGLIAACGMLEIAKHVDSHEQALYQDCAYHMVKAVADNYVNLDPTQDGITQGGAVDYHEREKNVSIIYGDYFFIEALVRLTNQGFHIW